MGIEPITAIFSRLFLALSLTMAATAIDVAIAAPPVAGPAAKEVEAAVREVARVYAANDYRAYFSYFDDDILISGGPTGRWTKQDYVTLWSKRIDQGGGVASLSVDALDIRVGPRGDTAVVMFVMPVVSRNAGAPVAAPDKPDIIYTMTEVWMKRGTRWSMAFMGWVAKKTS